MGSASSPNFSCLAAVCALSRRAMLKHNNAPVAGRTRKIITVKCRVRTLGSQLIRPARYSKTAVLRANVDTNPNFQFSKFENCLRCRRNSPSRRIARYLQQYRGGFDCQVEEDDSGLAILN